MKRFSAVLDASLNDDEGEQGGLMAFSHRVLQPDNDMVSDAVSDLMHN